MTRAVRPTGERPDELAYEEDSAGRDDFSGEHEASTTNPPSVRPSYDFGTVVRPSVDVRVRRLSFNHMPRNPTPEGGGQGPSGPPGAGQPSVDAAVVEDVDQPEYARQAYEAANHPKSFTTKVMKAGMISIYMFEKWVIVVLALILAIFIVATLIECGYGLVMAFSQPPHLIMGTTQYLALLSSFFYTLIGIELLQSVAIHIETSDAHVEVILLVAITAVSRKIIILDSEHAGLEKMAGIALLCVALGATYFLVKYGHAIGRQIILAESGQSSGQTEGETEHGSAKSSPRLPKGLRLLSGAGATKRPSMSQPVIVATAPDSSGHGGLSATQEGRGSGLSGHTDNQGQGAAAWDRFGIPRLLPASLSAKQSLDSERNMDDDYEPPVRHEIVFLHRGAK